MNNINMDTWNLVHTQSMGSMFRNCTSLTSINIAGWNLSIQNQYERLRPKIQWIRKSQRRLKIQRLQSRIILNDLIDKIKHKNR